MEKNKRTYIFIAATLAILVPPPGRFAYGLVLILLFDLTLMAGILFRKLIERIHLTDFQPVLVSVFFIFFAVVYKELLNLFSPSMSFVLGFDIYMPAVSAFMIGSLYQKSEASLIDDIRGNMKEAGRFSVIAVLFFLIRDILGYGTFTLPYHYGIKEFDLFSNTGIAFVGAFWASLPGALVLSALLYILLDFISKKLEMVKDLGDDFTVESGNENTEGGEND